MSNVVKRSSAVVLVHKTKRTVVTGFVAEDFRDAFGVSSIISVDAIIGLDVGMAMFNTNMWELYYEGKPGFDFDAQVKLIREVLKQNA